MGAEIPVWVGGLQKWVTGLTKKTTCEDIVKVLLRSEGRPLATEDREWPQYVLVERWRKVERPIDAKSKILKVWKAWGEEQNNVKFALRRHHPPMTPKEVKLSHVHRTSKHHHHNHHQHHHRPGAASVRRQGLQARTTTIHPRKLLQQSGGAARTAPANDNDVDGRITETMERLMKVIIAQGETIQAQLRRLQDKEVQIDHFEQQMHVMRVEEMGANYLVDTYLGHPGSAVGDPQIPYTSLEAVSVAPPPTESCSDSDATVRELRRCVRYYERFLELCGRVEREEEAVARLTAQLHSRQQQQLETDGGGGGAAKSMTEDSDDLLVDVEAAAGNVERLAAINSANEAELEENDAALADIHRLLDDKNSYVLRLERDLELAEEEERRLRLFQQESGALVMLQHLQPPPSERDVVTSVPVVRGTTIPTTPRIVRGDKDQNNDTDSNSDTGLSSLHSSSDDGAYALDTLV